MKFALFFAAVPAVHGFISQPRLCPGRVSTRSSGALMMVKTPEKKTAAAAKTEELIDAAKDTFGQLQGAVKDFNVDDLKDDFSAALEGVKASVKEGKFGERGEAWTAAQVALLFFIVVGDIPFIGGPVEALAVPLLLVGGAGLVAAGVLQLGGSMSPWPTPREGNVLKTSGVYSVCRHPMYAGLILFSFGLGLATDSFVRIALAGLLAYVLDIKASEEENELMAIHPAYKTYAEEVARFFPKVY